MSLGRNLARARSHIIFIIALLAASAYILWVERGRGVPSSAPGTEMVRLHAGPEGRGTAERLCAAARAQGLACQIVPVSPGASTR
jgi:hypothetical protein